MVNNRCMRRTVKCLVWLSFILALIACASKREKNQAASDSSANEIFDLVYKADLAYSQDRWVEASRYYNQVILRVPKDHYAWFRLANTQLQLGHTDAAIYSYNEAIKRQSQHVKAHYNLSLAYIFKSLDAIEQSYLSMREQDPGRKLIRARMKDIQRLVAAPLEQTKSPAANR